MNLLADSVVLELAGSRVTAIVGSTASRSSTVAVLAFLNDAVSALPFRDDRNTPVGAQASRVHTS